MEAKQMNTAKAKWQVLVVDDHPIFRHGVSQLLGTMPEVEICGHAENALTALEAVRRLKPELALIDVSMPGINGIELLKLLLSEHPKLNVLIFSMHDESLYALRALRAGAKGYVMKHTALENIFDAVRKVMAGQNIRPCAQLPPGVECRTRMA